MNKVVIIITLFVLAGLPGSMLAQSGRHREAEKSAVSGGVQGKTASADQDQDNPSDAANEAQGDHKEETVEGDTIRVNTALVTLPVSVIDRDGRFIPNLRRSDFRIFENGLEQRVAYFATTEQPFTVALVIDTSNSTHFKLEDIQSAAIAFVDQLRPDDRVMVVSFDDRINVLTQPTSDRLELTRAIRRTRTGGGTRLYDAVHVVMQQQLSQIKGRKAVVLFTDGVDTTSRKATYESTVREAEEFDALIYTVDYDTYESLGPNMPSPTIPFPRRRGGIILGSPFPGGPFPGSRGGRGGGSSQADYRRAVAYLHDLAEKTGGRFYNGDSLQSIAQAFEQVAEELRRQYSIGYYPKSAGQSGERRQIKVRVTQPGLIVKARDTYVYAPKEPQQTTQANYSPLEVPATQKLVSKSAGTPSLQRF